MDNKHNELCNLKLRPPSDGSLKDCNTMHAYTDGERILSWWKPNERERYELAAGGQIVLHIWGQRQPPVALTVEPWGAHLADTVPMPPYCNRKTCMVSGARWWNQSTRAWYCEPCAKLINATHYGVCITFDDLPDEWKSGKYR